MEKKQNNKLAAMEWRYATKKFDTTKSINDEDLSFLLDNISLAPSSFGLQPYKIFVIESRDIREKLKAAAYDQPQVNEAAKLIVFASKTSISPEYIEDYIKNISTIRGIETIDLKGFSDAINTTVSNFSKEQLTAWSKKQAYIALGILLQTAAELRVDAAPMEGFSDDEFDEILNLKQQGLTTAVIAAIGYRIPEDDTQYLKKVRLPKEKLFEYI